MNKLLFWVFFSCISLITFFSFFKEFSEFLFVGGSTVSLSRIVSPFLAWSLFFAFLMLVAYVYLSGKMASFRVILLILFGFWLLSGRTVAINSYPDGIIRTGWFYFKSDEFQLCDSGVSCEDFILKNVRIKEGYAWRLYINSDKYQKVIFVGPFSWEETISSFKEENFIVDE